MAKFKFAPDVRAEKNPAGGYFCPPEDIIVGENLSRYVGTPLEVEELAKQIKADGKQITPVLCRPHYATGKPELVAGNRRLEAIKFLNAGGDEFRVWLLLEELSDGEAALRDLTSNEGKALGPMDRATAYHNCITRNGWKQSQLAEYLNKTEAHVSQYLGLLNLAEEVKQKLAVGGLTLQEALNFKGLSREKQVEVVENKERQPETKVSELVAQAKREENTAPSGAEDRVAPTRKIVKSAGEIRRMVTEGLGKMNPAMKPLAELLDAWIRGERGEDEVEEELQIWVTNLLQSHLLELKEAGKIRVVGGG